MRPDFEDEHLLALDSLVELRHLALSWCYPVTERGLQGLSSLQHLESLSLRGCRLSDASARCLAELPLAHVRFGAAAQELSESGMRVLAAAPLRSLRFEDAVLDGASTAPLAGHPTLTDLALPDAHITVDGVRTLGSLPRLRRLDLRGVIDDRALGELVPLAGQLQSLHAGLTSTISDAECTISDAGCESLAAFRELVFLDIHATGVTGAGLRALSGLRKLEHLALDCLDLDDTDVRAIASLTNLRSLSLGTNQQITDGVIETLAQLPSSSASISKVRASPNERSPASPSCRTSAS